MCWNCIFLRDTDAKSHKPPYTSRVIVFVFFVLFMHFYVFLSWQLRAL